MDYWTSNGIIINHWLWMTLFTLAWPTWPLTVPADALSVWVVDGSSLILQHRVNTSLVVSFFSVPNCSHFRYFLKHQTTEQYSRRGRTYVVKALTRLLISRERKHFKIRFAILCPLNCYFSDMLWKFNTVIHGDSQVYDLLYSSQDAVIDSVCDTRWVMKVENTTFAV